MALFTRRSLEGEVVVDHRESPGLPELAERTGRPLGKGQIFKAPIATCSHCQRGVILNPLRTRDRYVCHKCDKYICDSCNLNLTLTGVCYPWIRRMEDIFNATVKGQNHG
jgi:hypothetical protein